MKIINTELIKKLKKAINASSKVLITTHVNSDGDAIGSSLALALILKKLGKEVRVMTPNDFPEFLKWIPGQELIFVHYREAKEIKKWNTNSDLLFAVDFNDPKRLKDASGIFLKSDAFKVLIDHHPSPLDFTDLQISVTSLSSAAELLYYVIIESGYRELIDKDIATCLFTGIMTDTGCFSYGSSYPEIYQTCAELVRYGIDKDYIYSKVYDNYSADRMKLMGYCLNDKMVVLQEYNTAYISLTREELKRFNHLPGDTEGFVNMPFSIQGIKLIAFFIEKNDYIKISFRSRGRFSVNDFSKRYFNGGGHLNAAGGEYKDTLENTISRFLELLPTYKDSLK